MSTTGQEAINAISSPPDDVTLEDIMYRLNVINKINRRREVLKNSGIPAIHELKREVQSW
ncbi:MAG TPA: hypothetical protein VLM75_02180 [Spirochaetota bacterium]|nr:hypothetical protein [Spirochaetota bacterium]